MIKGLVYHYHCVERTQVADKKNYTDAYRTSAERAERGRGGAGTAGDDW